MKIMTMPVRADFELETLNGKRKRSTHLSEFGFGANGRRRPIEGEALVVVCVIDFQANSER